MNGIQEVSGSIPLISTKNLRNLRISEFFVVFPSFDTQNLTIFNKVETAKYVETLQQECDKNHFHPKIGHFSSIISIVSI